MHAELAAVPNSLYQLHSRQPGDCKRSPNSMSVALIIVRSGGISVAEWRQLVGVELDLRIRTEPYKAVNPRNQERLSIPVGEADAELRIGDQWVPFLRFDNGQLICEFTDELEDPDYPARRKIVAVAKYLKATISTDAGDDVLAWN